MLKSFKLNTILIKSSLSYVLIAFCMLLHAQNIKFEHIKNDDGLPALSITSIYQDAYGFIWMGSMSGIIKFDGKGYDSFVNIIGDTTSVSGNLITEVFCASNGLVYAAVSNSGLCILNPKTEICQNISPDNTADFASRYVNAIVPDSMENLWLATNNGLNYYDIKTDKFSYINLSHYLSMHVEDTNFQNYISSAALDAKGNLYLLGYNGLLFYYHIKTQEITKIDYTHDAQGSILLFNSGKLFVDKYGKVWIGTENNGLYIFDPLQNKTIHHYLNNIIISAINIIDNKVWVGTDGEGLHIFNIDGTLFESHRNEPYDPFSISSNAIYCIYKSNDGTIWTGNYSTGVNLYNPSRYKFSAVTDIGIRGRRLTHKAVMCVEQLNDSILLIGTDGGGINKFNLHTKSIWPLKSVNNEFDNKVAKAICMVGENQFYIGTYSKGLYFGEILSNGLLRVEPVERKSTGRFKHVWALAKISDTAIWVGYLNGGLSIYNPGKKRFKSIESFKNYNIYKIKKLNNEIWISAQEQGLTIVDENAKILQNFRRNVNDSTTISSDFIYSIFKDSKNRVWIGSNDGGLNLVLNKKQSIFKRIGTVQNFPTNMITNIEEDEDGMLWLSSNEGLFHFNPETETFESFDKEDGLHGKKFTDGASFTSTDGTMCFGGAEGFSFFHPKYIKKNEFAPQVVISNLLLDNKKVQLNEIRHGDTILKTPIPYLNMIELSHHDNDFTLEFAALHYEASFKNRYQYKLEGFDNDWITCPIGQNSARYTNLRKGTFIFKVKAGSVDGVWSKDATELKIIIHPAFYETTWFYIVLFLLLLLIVAVYTKWRIYKLDMDRKKLRQLVDLKTEAVREKTKMVVDQNIKITRINNQLKEFIEARDKVFSIIAHDLRSPLNAIISFSNILELEYETISDEERKKFIEIIGNTSIKMNELITNLLFWVNNQVGKIEPKPVLNKVKYLFDDLNEFTKANILEKELNIRFMNNDATIYADHEMLVTIIRNLLGNSIKFTPKKGSIEVKAHMNGETTTITIADTGVGMTKEQIDELEKRETLMSTKGTENESGTGLGLFLCKDFTEKNNGRFSIESEKGKGTKVCLEFPSLQI